MCGCRQLRVHTKAKRRANSANSYLLVYKLWILPRHPLSSSLLCHPKYWTSIEKNHQPRPNLQSLGCGGDLWQFMNLGNLPPPPKSDFIADSSTCSTYFARSVLWPLGDLPNSYYSPSPFYLGCESWALLTSKDHSLIHSLPAFAGSMTVGFYSSPIYYLAL